MDFRNEIQSQCSHSYSCCFCCYFGSSWNKLVTFPSSSFYDLEYVWLRVHVLRGRYVLSLCIWLIQSTFNFFFPKQKSPKENSLPSLTPLSVSSLSSPPPFKDPGVQKCPGTPLFSFFRDLTPLVTLRVSLSLSPNRVSIFLLLQDSSNRHPNVFSSRSN